MKEKRSITATIKEESSKTDDNFNWDELTNNEIYSKDERLDLEKHTLLLYQMLLLNKLLTVRL